MKEPCDLGCKNEKICCSVNFNHYICKCHPCRGFVGTGRGGFTYKERRLLGVLFLTL